MTVIPFVIGALRTLLKGFVKDLEDFEIRGQEETIQTKAFLGSASILRKVLETWGDLVLFKLQWKTISLCWWEKLSRSNVIIIIIIIKKWTSRIFELISTILWSPSYCNIIQKVNHKDEISWRRTSNNRKITIMRMDNIFSRVNNKRQFKKQTKMIFFLSVDFHVIHVETCRNFICNSF